jgi:hypothetical protein
MCWLVLWNHGVCRQLHLKASSVNLLPPPYGLLGNIKAHDVSVTVLGSDQLRGRDHLEINPKCLDTKKIIWEERKLVPWAKAYRRVPQSLQRADWAQPHDCGAQELCWRDCLMFKDIDHKMCSVSIHTMGSFSMNHFVIFPKSQIIYYIWLFRTGIITPNKSNWEWPQHCCALRGCCFLPVYATLCTRTKQENTKAPP